MDTLLAIALSCMLRSGTDYVGYNLTKNNSSLLNHYRAAEFTGTGYLAYTLFEKYDAKTGGKFLLLQWCFTNDLLYYGWAWVINPAAKHGFENRADVKRVLLADYPVPHAKWTMLAPISDGMRMPAGLAMQSLLGISISIKF